MNYEKTKELFSEYIEKRNSLDFYQDCFEGKDAKLMDDMFLLSDSILDKFGLPYSYTNSKLFENIKTIDEVDSYIEILSQQAVHHF